MSKSNLPIALPLAFRQMRYYVARNKRGHSFRRCLRYHYLLWLRQRERPDPDTATAKGIVGGILFGLGVYIIIALMLCL